LLGAGSVEPAVELWNAVADRGLTAQGNLAPNKGRSLTNGDFRREFTGHGFDWRPVANNGVSLLRSQDGFRIEFSGKQPERCEIVWQYVPLAAAGNYRLRARLRSADQMRGLKWRVTDPASRRVLAEGSQAESEADVRFVAPAPLARLALVYEREPGTMRLEGTGTIEQVSLELAQ
jgi:hypothetical protein